MSNLSTLQSLFNPTYVSKSLANFLDTDIVFERLVNDMERLKNHWLNLNPSSRIVNHPTNVSRNGDEYTIEVALAGFSKNDIEIVDETVEGRRALIVSGKIEKENGDENTSVISRQISRRDFKKTFSLTENAVVGDATFENGLLTIKVTVPSKVEPETKSLKIEVK